MLAATQVPVAQAQIKQEAAFARSLLEPLSESQRMKLVAAMAQVERLLIASQVQITVADPSSPDVRTNCSLIEAIQLYRDCGYQEVEAFNDEPYAHHWFEKCL
jgi:hypothetical protein